MIRYPITRTELLRLFEEESEGWTQRARQRVRRFVRARRFNDRSPIWSEVKRVYIRLQHAKCAFCERKLEGSDFGAIEHDVEHFRPKSEVKVWPDEVVSRSRGISYAFDTGAGMRTGYYWLAYEPFNYATACKTCNSILKSSYFPVAGRRARARAGVERLSLERAFLLYPIGTLDVDPESVLTFMGVTPVSTVKRGDRRRRAVVTIDFFELDTREELLRGRAEQINTFWLAKRLAARATTAHDQAAANATVRRLQSASSPHAAAVRAFSRLHDADPSMATTIYGLITKYLNRES